jgi:hypothetical protein
MDSTRTDLLQVLDALIEQKVERVVARVLSQATPAEVSTVRLPADAKNEDAFNRACRSGRVEGARKVGRIWVATLDAWNRRASAEQPKGIAPRTRRKSPPETAAASATELRADVLAELGAVVRRVG